jgi:hypothetical protein
MIALALALGLAASAGPDDTDLPRSLSVDETPYLVAPAAAKDESSLWVGGHLGVSGAYDAADPNFTIGGGARFKLLSWLALEATVDFNARQSFDSGQIHLSQTPVEIAGLFYPPLELNVRPYGIFGVGFTFTNVSYSGSLGGLNDTLEVNRLFFLGFGAEFELQDNIMLDANLRFIFTNNPSHFQGNSADWIQFTVGILFKLSK